jgi:hypothetical protein
MKLARGWGPYHKDAPPCDLSDEIIGIIGIPAICEYTLRPVDIYIYCLPRFLPA